VLDLEIVRKGFQLHEISEGLRADRFRGKGAFLRNEEALFLNDSEIVEALVFAAEDGNEVELIVILSAADFIGKMLLGFPREESDNGFARLRVGVGVGDIFEAVFVHTPYISWGFHELYYPCRDRNR
jgi:hypothetical protein